MPGPSESVCLLRESRYPWYRLPYSWVPQADVTMYTAACSQLLKIHFGCHARKARNTMVHGVPEVSPIPLPFHSMPRCLPMPLGGTGASYACRCAASLTALPRSQQSANSGVLGVLEAGVLEWD